MRKYSMELRGDVSQRLRLDFNFINFDLLQKVSENWYEGIIYPVYEEQEFTLTNEQKEYFTSDIKPLDYIRQVSTGNVYRVSEVFSDKSGNYFVVIANGDTFDINDVEKVLKLEDEKTYRVEYASETELEDLHNIKEAENKETFEKEVNEDISNIMWWTLFESRDSGVSEKIRDNVYELYELGVTVIEDDNFSEPLLGVRGAGYDFYEDIWIPMYTEIFGWVHEEDFQK